MESGYMTIYIPYLDSSSSQSPASLWSVDSFDLVSPLPDWPSHVSETPKILPDTGSVTPYAESLYTTEVEESSRDACQEESPTLSLSRVDNDDDDDNQIAVRNNNGKRGGLNSSSYTVTQPARKRQKIGVGRHTLIGTLLIVVPEAKYGSASTNIFLRMQQTTIPREEEDPYLKVIPCRLPAPDDFLYDDRDGRYLKLLLDKGKIMVKPLGFFFPKACERILKTAMDYKPLRHAIVAIAMQWDRHSLANSRLDLYLKSLTSNEPSSSLILSNSVVQDAEIFAVFLVLTLTELRLPETKDIESLRRHVQRLYNLFSHAQEQAKEGRRETLSPLLFSIWRQVMRTNIHFALGVMHNRAVFPPPARHAGGHEAFGHGPYRQYLGSCPREFEDWTLAALELDDLGTRTFRLHLQANSVRGSKTRDKLDEEILRLNSGILARENEQWKQKPVIQVAEYMELLYRQQHEPEPSPERKFLDYPPIRFKNPLYACLLLTHYALAISLSLIVYPRVGPRTTERIEAAVEICRIYASLGGNHPVGSLTCLASVWWAGLTFDSRKYPKGINYIGTDD